jgi:glycosyltransferase involved in cell wall biosynthesis
MTKRKPTITIGIPAHNEGQTIGDLLRALLRQKGAFTIEKILVICDGCTDDTPKVVAALNDARITVLNDGKRLGKARRLNQLYASNTSDYLLTFDGDILPGSDREISHLLAVMHEQATAQVVAGHIRLIDSANGFTARMLYYNHLLWAKTTQTYRNGRNIHTSHGPAYLLTRAFVAQHRFPESITCDQGFIYLFAQPDGYFFAEKSAFFSNPVSKFSEIRVGYNRTINERNDIGEYFGREALNEFHIPFTYRLLGIVRSIPIHPLYMSFAVLFNVFMRLAPTTDSRHHDGLWSISHSVKKKIRPAHL